MIYVFAPDADGCLFHHAYRKSLVPDVVAHNSELLDFVAQQAVGSSQFLVLVGSNRQSPEIDVACRKKTKTASVFIAIEAVSGHLKATLNKFLLADIFFDRPDGDSFQYGTDSSYKCVNRFYIDNTKLILLYAQMHHIANLNPREKIIYDFYDDRGLMPDSKKEILEHLDEFFTRYPEMIPINVSLRLNHYGNSRIITPIKQIEGAGIIDANYRRTVKSMYEMTTQATPVIKDGLIYSALHVNPALLSCRGSSETSPASELDFSSFSDGELETIDLDGVVIQAKEASQPIIDQERSSSLHGTVGSFDRDEDLISVDLGDKSPRLATNAVAVPNKSRWCCFRLFGNPSPATPLIQETESQPRNV